jgi:hypothetical protein
MSSSSTSSSTLSSSSASSASLNVASASGKIEKTSELSKIQDNRVSTKRKRPHLPQKRMICYRLLKFEGVSSNEKRHVRSIEHYFRATNIKPVVMWLLEHELLSPSSLLYYADKEEKVVKKAQELCEKMRKTGISDPEFECAIKLRPWYQEFVDILGGVQVQKLIECYYDALAENASDHHTWIIEKFCPNFLDL